jgi:hypothetical protein
MRQLLESLGRLSRKQKLAVAIVFIIVLLTWLSVCLVVLLPAR